jgi:DNA primase
MRDKEVLKDLLGRYLRKIDKVDPDRSFTSLNPEHDDQNCSMFFDPVNKRVYCFACGAKYDIFDVIGIDFEVDRFSEKMKTADEFYDNLMT